MHRYHASIDINIDIDIDIDLSSFFCLRVWVPDHSIGFRRDADQQAIGTTPRAGIVGTTPRIQLTPSLPHQISNHSALTIGTPSRG